MIATYKEESCFFETNDRIKLHYRQCLPTRSQTNDSTTSGNDDFSSDKVIILIHGWTGSSDAWSRSILHLGSMRRTIALDLRGHGESDKPVFGHHVSRLALDLQNLIDYLKLPLGKIVGVGASLGCAVLWSYLELFGASTFSDLVFIDQSPYQNYAVDGSWGPVHGSKGCNSAATLADLQTQIVTDSETFYKGMQETCLGYRSHPTSTDIITDEQRKEDEMFFLNMAKKGNPIWYGKLMADHTNLDWRATVAHTLSQEAMTRQVRHTQVLVIASSRSGCFNPEGPLEIVKILERAGRSSDMSGSSVKGVTVDWGGHWLYWENAAKFNQLLHQFLSNDTFNASQSAKDP